MVNIAIRMLLYFCLKYLLCAGATVFEPVIDYVMPGTKVAVASIGGLRTKAI
jgi:D-arabinose 1-dehydrogenase-like Zn-dependent alcohol dehydrogenase